MPHQMVFHVSEAAKYYVLQIVDKYRDANITLVERLGEANWQRHNFLRMNKQRLTKIDCPEIASHEPPKSIFQPFSVFHDSGLGTSLPAQSQVAISVASHTSFLSEEGDRHRRRVPDMPDEVGLGKPFECNLCGQTLSSIKNRISWKMHVFADLKPYICTYENCPSALVTFPDRKSWAQHEFSCHRSDVIFKCNDCDKELTNEAAFSAHVEEYHVAKPSDARLLALAAAAREIRHHPANEQLCPLCLQNGWQDERKFITHVARHMEDIALSAVPRDDDTDTETTNVEPSHISATTSDDSDKPSQGSNNSYNTEIFLDGNSNQQRPASDSASVQWSSISTNMPVAPPVTATPAKKKINWPPAVRQYVQRCFTPESMIKGITKEEMESKLKKVITDARESSNLNNVDWAELPLPQQMIQEERNQTILAPPPPLSSWLPPSVSNVTHEAAGKSQNGTNSAFRTDADISASVSRSERVLQPWVPEAGTDVDLPLEFSGRTDWDQYFPPRASGGPNKYTPPARRAPTGQPTVAGAPVDPAIISAQLSRPATKPQTNDENATKATADVKKTDVLETIDEAHRNGTVNCSQQPQAEQPPTVERPFKCDQCPQSFNRNHDLKRHKRIHLAVRRFPCYHCDKSFLRKDALKRHILVKGCGRRGDVESSRDDDGQSNVKSESGSVGPDDSPAMNGR